MHVCMNMYRVHTSLLLLLQCTSLLSASVPHAQLRSDIVSGEQEVRKSEKTLLSHLCTSRHTDYWRLTQKVAATVTAKKEVSLA